MKSLRSFTPLKIVEREKKKKERRTSSGEIMSGGNESAAEIKKKKKGENQRAEIRVVREKRRSQGFSYKNPSLNRGLRNREGVIMGEEEE